jgi:aspartate/methionine/tyrosine aminotransferase
MNVAERVMASEYIEWAKTASQSRFNLATSGVTHYPINQLGVTLDDIELNGPSLYGYQPLQKALADKSRVAPDCVVAAIGTSLANHLAMAVVVERGDEVLIEYPAYEPLVSLARYLGCEVKRFRREAESEFRIDTDEVRRQVTPRTRLIVITNLHNPSGTLIEEQTLRELGEIARSVRAKVLVDEVYLEMLYLGNEANSSPRPDERSETSVKPVDPSREALATSNGGVLPVPYAFKLGAEFITTTSLTKAYGLSGLRCGWILAEPELAKKMWRLNDLFGNIAAHPAERLSVVALQRLDRIADRAGTLLASHRSLLGHKYETTVVPGRFFEMPDYFRIGIGCDTEMLESGLSRLGAALDELG